LTAAASILCVAAGDRSVAPAAAPGVFTLSHCKGLDAAAERLANAHFDGLVIATRPGELPALLVWPALSQAVSEAALLVVADDGLDGAAAVSLIQRGVQDVLSASADEATIARALRFALERKAQERSARKAYATDLTTGLPNQPQLVEHINQLLALREREPAPMALLVLRIEGLATAEARLGSESANVLRRKIAVRLRAGVRASDVVASLGGDSFAVLLSKFVNASDAERVADKLVASLHRPFSLSGGEAAVAVARGVAQSPGDGRDAESLLRRAQGLAAAAQATGRVGFANHVERGAAPAANDEEGLDE
jgi:diguanylate cyclase (GGDEF)-like protein